MHLRMAPDKWHKLFLNQLLISFQMSYTSSAKLTGGPRGVFLWFNDFQLLLLFPLQPGGQSLALTVNSFIQSAEIGALCPRSCVRKESLFRSQMMQVRSRDPLTMMWYASDAVKHVTVSVWPSSACKTQVRSKSGNQERAQKFHIKASYLKDSDNLTRISHQKMQPPYKSSVDNYFYNWKW